MEAYKIWATLNLKGDLQSKLKSIIKDLKAAEAALKKLNTNLNTANTVSKKTASNFDKVAKATNAMSTALVPVNNQFSNFNNNLRSASSASGNLIARVRMLSQEIRSLNQSAGGSRRGPALLGYGGIVPSSGGGGRRGAGGLGYSGPIGPSMRGGSQWIPGGGGGGGRRGGGGWGSYEDADFYSVAGGGRGGGGPAAGGGGRRGGGRGRFHGIHHAAAFGLGAVVPQMGALTAAGYMGGGIGVAAAGAAIMTAQGFQQNKELGKINALFMGQGFTPQQMAEVNRLEMTAPKGISPQREGMALLHAQMGLRNWGEAKKIAPTLAKIGYAADYSFGGMTKKQEVDLIRFAEFMNVSGSQEEMKKWLNVGAQMTISSGGSIMPSEQATFLRQSSGVVAGHMTPEAYLALEPVMQEYRGSKLGTAFTTGIRAMMNPQMSNFAKYHVNKLKQFGLWDEKSNRMKQSFLDLAQSDPDLFLRNVWLPALAKQGITSPNRITQETTADLPRTWGTAMNIMYNKMPITAASRANAKNLMNIDEYFNTVFGQEAGAQGNLSASWERLTTAWGKLADPGIIKAMNMLSDFLEYLAKIFDSINQKDYRGAGSLVAGGIKSELGMAASFIPGYSLISSAAKGVYGQFKDIASPSSPQSGGQSVGHVYLDANKVGRVMYSKAPSILNPGGVEMNQSGFNSALNLAPNALNYVGGST